MTTIPLDEYLNRVIEEYTSRPYQAELQKAKAEFFGFIGSVHEEDPFYESYMAAFIEWYILDRELIGKDLAPIRLFYRDHFKTFNEEEQKVYNDLTKFKHSIFLVKKVTPSMLMLDDLFHHEKIKFENSIPTIAFNSGDIFEAILVPFRGDYTLTKTFFYHPPESKSFMTKEIKKMSNSDAKTWLSALMRFRRLKLKTERYPYVSAGQIYTREEFAKGI